MRSRALTLSLASGLCAAGVAASAASGQVVLHSTLSIVNSQSYNRADADVRGGSAFFGSAVDEESADDFTLAAAATLTSVTLDYVTFFGGSPPGGLEVNVWTDLGGAPGTLLYSTNTAVASASSFTDTVFGMAGRRLTANVNVPLTAATYWVTMKPVHIGGTNDAYFSLRDSTFVSGAPTVGRDIVGTFYGSTTWITLPMPGNGGATSMEIQGIVVPAPASAALLAGAACLGLRRRR